jgi:ferritin
MIYRPNKNTMTKLRPTKTFKEVLESWDDAPTMDMDAVAVVSAAPMTSNTPVIPMTPKTLDGSIVSALEARLKDEYTAHLIYKNAANWCKNVGYVKAAAFFEAEAADELTHAQKLQDYMVQWNVLPQIPVATVPNTIKSLIDSINGAYVFEYNLLQSYSQIQVEVDGMHPATFNFIQEFVDIQNESVGVFSDLLNALMLVDYNNRLDLLMFEDKYFG